MAKKFNIADVLDRLEKAQSELAKKRVKAIQELNIEKDEELRNHMLALDGFKKDLEDIASQLNDYIVKHKILTRGPGRPPKKKSAEAPAKAKAKKKKVARAKKKAVSKLAKPLPAVGTKLYGKYKGKEYWADVTKEGIVIEGVDGVFKTMSAAAFAATGRKNLSGWMFWKVISL